MMLNAFEILSEQTCFAGKQFILSHQSSVLDCTMRFAVYLPPNAEASKCPVLWFLSGLTCTEENFVIKSGMQRYAAEHNMVVVSPDTSPRGTNTEGEDTVYSLGTGAGFYVNATQLPWAKHYQMDEYITGELQQLIVNHFPVDATRQAITGFSMGGHGALVLGLRTPELYSSISAMAPIAHPSQCGWGRNAFKAYLGDDVGLWRGYDATCLVEDGYRTGKLLVDQGAKDEFLSSELLPDVFVSACEKHGQPIEYRLLRHYDHSFYFVASVIGHHTKWHAQNLASA